MLLAAASVALLAAASAGCATDLLQAAPLAILLAFAPLNAAFHGIRGHHHAFLAGYAPESCTTTQRAAHHLVLRSARTLVYALGSIATIIGLVHVLGALDDPIKVGRGLAVLLTAPLYAVTIAELFISPRLRRLQAAGPLEEPGVQAILAAAGRGRAPLRQSVATIAAAMLLFCICMLALALSPRQFHEMRCCDAVDNDQDGLIDAADPDCLRPDIKCPDTPAAATVEKAAEEQLSEDDDSAPGDDDSAR